MNAIDCCEYDDKMKDIQEHPELHRHDFPQLQACCMVGDAIDLSLMEAHSKYVNLGTNGGQRCDVVSGPCSCGAWH